MWEHNQTLCLQKRLQNFRGNKNNKVKIIQQV